MLLLRVLKIEIKTETTTDGGMEWVITMKYVTSFKRDFVCFSCKFWIEHRPSFDSSQKKTTKFARGGPGPLTVYKNVHVCVGIL